MPESDLALLTRAAEEAGKIASRFWQQDPQVWDKPADAGPVTEADLAVDTMLKDVLLQARPDYGWLSEETEDDDARLTSEHVFIVDPIDGTRAFIDGKRTWAHSLAIARAGTVETAVVALPERGKVYAATLGGGATLNGAAITASPRTDLCGACTLAARPTFEDRYWPGGAPAVERHFRSSLAYRLCLVAEGRFDAMITLRDSWEWDVAAGTLIALEAGAVVTDRAGKDVRFNQPGAKGPGIMAMAPGIAGQIIALR